LSNNTFNTSQLTITPPDQTTAGTHISIDPSQIVLSKSPLSSSMRNHFQGRITAITEELNNILVTVNAGETFHVVITHQASSELRLNIGDKIWLNFKSNAVTIF
ncbi:MAG: TOBE domain-containing protein, partial [Methylococcales bacterium]|nr:TOBE domain-containing protein [Methylococcales bacterium]